MDLRFELGDSQQPRGHAILFASVRSSGGEQTLATYCVVPPIQFAIGKYLPPLLVGQMPAEALGESASESALPIPPMLETTAGLDALRQLAEHRGDDLCDLGTILINDDTQRLAYAAEAAASYGSLYARYLSRWQAEAPQSSVSTSSTSSTSFGFGSSRSSTGPSPLDDIDVDAVMVSVRPERDRLSEMARLVGQARYAMDGADARLLAEVSAQLKRLAASLPEKYRADQLAEAALRRDATGPQLAGLYLQRAYKLLDEDYIDIPPIEQQIRELREQGESAGG
ncbi:MAG: hypothetical protein ABI068_03500 [Ktedonobacterales bacterium]